MLKTSCSFPLSDIFGDNIASMLNKETNSTDKMGQCRLGLELIFRKPGNDFGRQTADMDESEEADEGQLKSRGFWFHGKEVSLRPKTRFDMDESEEADEGSLKVNSGIGVGQKTSNFWGGSRRRSSRRRSSWPRRPTFPRRRSGWPRRRIIGR